MCGEALAGSSAGFVQQTRFTSLLHERSTVLHPERDMSKEFVHGIV